MENNKGKFYTAGEFAEKAGVTIRTIRYYDNEGLLKPTTYSESGYRLYCEKDFAKLQKIITLKYLGLSLGDIAEMVKEDVDEEGLMQSLSEQKELLEKKIVNMKSVLKSIQETEKLLKDNNFNWHDVIGIIDLVNENKSIVNQYKNSKNLVSRINIHDKFSTNKYGWHRWMWDNMNLTSNIRVLEIGCGNGELWKKNADRLPKDCKIYLTDISEGMLEDAKKKLKNIDYNFIFSYVDAQDIPYEDEYFDVVIANHMLFHVKDRKKALGEIRRVLKKEGVLYASTIGNDHMKEIHELCSEYDERIDFSSKKFQEDFGLETGKEQLEKIFNTVEVKRYNDSLLVTESIPLIDYINSTIGNVKEILKNREDDFKNYLDKMIREEKGIKIRKCTGVFMAK